jgi:hypothetical protein
MSHTHNISGDESVGKRTSAGYCHCRSHRVLESVRYSLRDICACGLPASTDVQGRIKKKTATTSRNYNNKIILTKQIGIAKEIYKNGVTCRHHSVHTHFSYPGGYCVVPVGTAAVPVLWVLQMGTAGYCGYCGYCR